VDDLVADEEDGRAGDQRCQQADPEQQPVADQVGALA
jgi:hypothetical protein